MTREEINELLHSTETSRIERTISTGGSTEASNLDSGLLVLYHI